MVRSERLIKEIQRLGFTRLNKAKKGESGWCKNHNKCHKYTFRETVSFSYPRFFGVDNLDELEQWIEMEKEDRLKKVQQYRLQKI